MRNPLGVSTDPVTGEIVGGLAGLRELIRAKQEQAAQTDATTPSIEIKKDEPAKKSRRRNRSKNRKEVTDGFVLPVKTGDIVYGEVTNCDGRTDDVKLFATSDDKLYIYNRSLYPAQMDDYVRVAKRLLSNRCAFDRVEAGDISGYLNKAAKVAIDGDCLVYQDKYRIDSQSSEVMQMAQKVVREREAAAAATHDDKPVEPKVVAHDEVVEKVDANPSNLIDKVLAVQQVAKRVAGQGVIEPVDAMAIFLTLGQASTDLLEQTTGVDKVQADSVVDQLRRMRALGDQQPDGTYAMLIDRLDDLGKDVSYTLQSQADNFRAAVHTETVRGKKLVYDLDELFMVKAADEYLEQLAEFCRATPSRRVKRLFSGDSKVIKASEVLQAVSADHDCNALNTADYELFHQYVTKYMLAAGWLVANHSDGFPWLQFQVADTIGLTVDTLRYLMTNLGWVTAIYTNECLDSLACQIERLDVPDVHGAAGLKRILLTKLQLAKAELTEMEAKDVDDSQLPLIADDQKEVK